VKNSTPSNKRKTAHLQISEKQHTFFKEVKNSTPSSNKRKTAHFLQRSEKQLTFKEASKVYS
jgi:hypothetical protein